MSGLFGFLRKEQAPDVTVLRRMAAVTRRHAAQQLECAAVGPVEIASLHRRAAEPVVWQARSHSGRVVAWVSGEVFSTRHPLPALEMPDADSWQRALVEALEAHGTDAIAGLNGDFHVAIWDARLQQLSIAVDRFSTSPLYWRNTPGAFVFGCGVRAVLAGDNGAVQADCDAIREAVTFGGYRLGTRTNIAGVEMLRAGQVIHATVGGAVTTNFYWTWRDVPPSSATTIDEAADAVHATWRRAVRRRMRGAPQPGQTLSGGRDSRAVLAEAAPQAPSWKAVTYGVAGCDDATYAEQAAAAARVSWRFAPLYERTAPDWLERRTAEIQHTDGLIDLVDLMHLEHVSLLTDGIDCHFHGYLGDAIVGTTYDHVDSYDSAVRALSFTGAPIALAWEDARRRLQESSVWTPEASARALIFEHKFPQAIGRPSAALASWTGVRRPFLDLDLVDTVMGMSDGIRACLYDHWVRREYPLLFRRIPIQKTGAPAGCSPFRLTLVRARRVVRRCARAVGGAIGWRLSPWSRTFTADEAEFSRPGLRERIESAIVGPASIACEIWGRDVLKALLDNWFAGRGGSAQVIGALYSWEVYHRGLSAFLRDRTREAA